MFTTKYYPTKRSIKERKHQTKMASQSDKKNKRRIQNGLRILASDTRIKAENAAQANLPIIQNNQPTQLSEYLFQYWTNNYKRFKKEVHHLGRGIINKAPREFFSTFKKLGGTREKLKTRNQNGIQQLYSTNRT